MLREQTEGNRIVFRGPLATLRSWPEFLRFASILAVVTVLCSFIENDLCSHALSRFGVDHFSYRWDLCPARCCFGEVENPPAVHLPLRLPSAAFYV
jgi:hypothetical protein